MADASSSTSPTGHPGARPRLRPAVALFLLAPYVGEFVLGNQPITAFPQLILLAPMYGAGALVIREVVRRYGGGWPVIALLAAAYALVEEGLVDQMIVNPAYLGLPSFADDATFLGISLTLTAASLSLHTVWSICVPIALVEAFDPEPDRPWLGRRGLTGVGTVFVLGCVALAWIQYEQFRFVAGPTQFAVIGAGIGALVLAAVLVARRRPVSRTTLPGAPLSYVRVGGAGFGLSSLYWVLETVGPWFVGPWPVLACWVVLVGGSVVLLHRVASSPGWARGHRSALAGGVLLTYVWAAFVNTYELGVPVLIGVLGNVLFGASAVVLVVAATRTERRRSSPPASVVTAPGG